MILKLRLDKFIPHKISEHTTIYEYHREVDNRERFYICHDFCEASNRYIYHRCTKDGEKISYLGESWGEGKTWLGCKEGVLEIDYLESQE